MRRLRYADFLPLVIAVYAVLILAFLPFASISPTIEILASTFATAGLTASLVMVFVGRYQRQVESLIEAAVGLGEIDIKHVYVAKGNILSSDAERQIVRSVEAASQVRVVIGSDIRSSRSYIVLQLLEYAPRNREVAVLIGSPDSFEAETRDTENLMFDRSLADLQARLKGLFIVRLASTRFVQSFILTDDDVFLFVIPNPGLGMTTHSLVLQIEARSRLGSEYREVFDKGWLEAEEVRER